MINGEGGYEMNVKEIADLVGISVRTLHHYDDIGLLKPHKTTDAGYRVYAQDEIDLLQHILFFKELGFPLKQIKDIVHDPHFDQAEALHHHRKMLVNKKENIGKMIQTIDQSIAHLRGDGPMENKDKFTSFDFRHNPYEQEARDRWGDKAVDTSNENVKEMDTEQIETDMNELFRQLAAIRHEDPASEIAQKEIEKWYTLLNTFGTYSLEAFKGLGDMYVADVRFTKNIDQFGDGLATFMCEAMDVFAENKQSS